MDVPIKFGDSRSNDFRDIRGADFVAKNERTNIKWPIPIARNAFAFRLKTVVPVEAKFRQNELISLRRNHAIVRPDQ